MRRLLTAGIFGTILGIFGTGTANASIVSSGFLDEKLTEYALSTSLDLKVNQSDLTALSNKIGTLPTELDLYTRNFAYMFNNIRKIELPADYPLSQFIIDILFGKQINGEYMPGLQDIIGVIMEGGFLDESWGGYKYMGLPALSKNLGAPYLLENKGYVLNRTEFPFSTELFPDLEPQNVKFETSIIEYLEQDLLDIHSPTLAGVTNKLLNGWTDKNGARANPGLKGMYDGWTDKGGTYFPGLYNYSKSLTKLLNAYNFDSDLSRLLIDGANATTIRGVDYTGPVYPLWKLSEGIDKIGDLPTEIPNRETIWGRYGFVEAQGTPIDLPDTIGGMFAMLFNEDHRYRGLSLGNIMAKILMGFDNSNGVRTEGLDPLTNGWTDKNAGTTYLGVKDLNTKIGTLPDGIPPALAIKAEQLNERLSVKLDIKYPQSLGDLILDLYGTKEYKPGILDLALEAMLLVFDHEDTIIGVQSQNRKGILERIDNVETQIGTLPEGYDSVGAALTAIKGIAEDAKAAALAAIPDPKQEGSSGKFVLTVDIVGDNATYHWEKIDREGETTATTTTE